MRFRRVRRCRTEAPAFSVSVPGLSPSEAVGVVVAFIVLLFTLGSLIAAGMPLIIALLGVGVSMAGIWDADGLHRTHLSYPDAGAYAWARCWYRLHTLYRQQTSGAAACRNACERLDCAGNSHLWFGQSSFAGLTVIIALAGLFVAQIPLMTASGLPQLPQSESPSDYCADINSCSVELCRHENLAETCT